MGLLLLGLTLRCQVRETLRTCIKTNMYFDLTGEPLADKKSLPHDLCVFAEVGERVQGGLLLGR